MSARAISWRLLVIVLLVFVVFSAFEPPRVVIAAEEQALIVTIRLRSGDMGDAAERKRISIVEDQLSDAIKKSGAGEFDGDEFGEGVCTIYIYGPSAERLYSVARPILERFHPPAGSYIIKRYGKPGSKQDRIEIDGNGAAPK
jgi:hypothetical protein